MSLFDPMGGIKIFDAEMLGDAYEDWSQVRSPGRAARRRRQGHQQRIVTRYRANGKVIYDEVRRVMYMHPDDRHQVERELPRQRYRRS